MDFFQLFGRLFNYDEVGILLTLDSAEYFSKLPAVTTFGPRKSILTLLDPADSGTAYLF